MNSGHRRQVAKQLWINRSQMGVGRGVFSYENIRRGEYILKTGMPSGYHFLIFLNHSCKPNALLKKGRDRYSDTLFAIRNIKVVRNVPCEITIDYRRTRWSHYFDKIMKRFGGCRCPSCTRGG